MMKSASERICISSTRYVARIQSRLNSTILKLALASQVQGLCLLLHSFKDFWGGRMKVTICFSVTPDRACFLSHIDSLRNQKWGLLSSHTPPVYMLKCMPNDRPPHLKLSNCTKETKLNCSVKSPSVFLSHIWMQNMLVCSLCLIRNPKPPHWFLVFLCAEIWFALHATAVISSCY